ncbi:condensation domain protein [Filimonas lacunae]|nr:condensation domain protein [Filimonas lacunae]
MYVDAGTPVNCVFAASVTGEIDLGVLQYALDKIQAKHPLLRACIEEDSQGQPHFVWKEDMDAIPVRIVQRQSDSEWKQVYQEEWKKPFVLQRAPLARVVWMKGEGVSELVIVCPHCICDGVSFVALMRELLLLLDKPEEMLEPYTSFGNILELIPDEVVQRKRNRIKGTVYSWLARVLLPAKNVIAREESSYLLHWRLNAGDTASLLSACKKADTSVHAALSIAFLRAAQQVKGKGARNKVICPVDIRRYVEQVKEDHMFAFAPIVELRADKAGDKNFWLQTQLFKKSLKEKIKQLNVHELLLLSEYFHASVKKMVALLRSSKGSHDFTFSNMGQLNIPNNYQQFKVNAIYSPTVAFPWRNPNTIVVSAFNKELDFAFISDDSFLNRQDAECIRDKAMELLQQQVAFAERGIMTETGIVREMWMQRFVQRNMAWYFLTNVLVNWGVAYYGFDNRNAVHLFRGEHSFARFLLPMALLLPFCISWDITRKSILFFERQDKVLLYSTPGMQNRFTLKLAAKNGGITFALVTVVASCLYLFVPSDYTFNGTLLSIVQGMLAGLLAVLFTRYCIRYVERRVC